jgi:hypothetical protein
MTDFRQGEVPVVVPFGPSSWLRSHGWIEAPDGTWGYPNSTARNLRPDVAYQIGKLIEEADDE